MPEVLDDKKGYAIAEVYLVRFDRIIFTVSAMRGLTYRYE